MASKKTKTTYRLISAEGKTLATADRADALTTLAASLPGSVITSRKEP